jgi:hypothetical protein
MEYLQENFSNETHSGIVMGKGIQATKNSPHRP